MCFWIYAYTFANCQGRPHHHVRSWSQQTCHFTLKKLYKYERPQALFGIISSHTFFYLLLIGSYNLLGISFPHVWQQKDELLGRNFKVCCKFDQRWPRVFLLHLATIFGSEFRFWQAAFIGTRIEAFCWLWPQTNCRVDRKVWPSLTVVFMTVLG